jgi:HEPN domain-containing protein
VRYGANSRPNLWSRLRTSKEKTMIYDRGKRLQDCVDSFIQSSELLKIEFERNPSIIGISLVVNAAFAAELAMKRYIEIKTRNPVRGHKLRELWDQIDSETQSKIIASVCTSIPLDMARFIEYMDKCSSTFVDWRYMYEKDNNFTNYLFLFNLAEEVRKLQ